MGYIEKYSPKLLIYILKNNIKIIVNMKINFLRKNKAEK